MFHALFQRICSAIRRVATSGFPTKSAPSAWYHNYDLNFASSFDSFKVSEKFCQYKQTELWLQATFQDLARQEPVYYNSFFDAIWLNSSSELPPPDRPTPRRFDVGSTVFFLHVNLQQEITHVLILRPNR